MTNIFKSSKQIITDIHNEFDNSQERLLSEAKKIISENKISEIGKRHIDIGFTKTKAAVQFIEAKNISVANQEQANLIEYYKQHYPFQKFITEKELDRICLKYNLIYAPIANYKGDVPDKNIKEIESVSTLNKNDFPDHLICCKLKRDDSFWLLGGGSDWASIWGSEWYRIPSVINGKHFTSQYSASAFLRENMGFTKEYLVSSIENITIKKQGLFIAAPKKDFDLTGLQQGEFLNAPFTITKVEDPIVFRFVKGGAQIISKWGLEASDESIVNPVEN